MVRTKNKPSEKAETARPACRPSIFRGKTQWVRGKVTEEAHRLLKGHRAVLAGVSGFTGTISDGDVVEHLARGIDGTRAYLKAQAEEE